MGNKNTPFKDKAIVKARLAAGLSYSKSIEGTSIKSKMTAKKIYEEEMNDIGRMREEYLSMVSEAFLKGEKPVKSA